MAFDVRVECRAVRGDREGKWSCHQCLYAYRDPDEGNIFSIGKADGGSIRTCRAGADKGWIDEWLDDGTLRRVGVDAGFIDRGEGSRYRVENPADVESLLILRLQPAGNIMATRSRIVRPGTRVTCRGNRPRTRTVLIDRH